MSSPCLLIAGRYTVTVEAANFKKLVKQGIELNVAAKLELNLQRQRPPVFLGFPRRHPRNHTAPDCHHHTDDTRAFPSIQARHDLLARRVDANWLAGLVVRGIVDLPEAGEMVADLSYSIAKSAYKIS